MEKRERVFGRCPGYVILIKIRHFRNEKGTGPDEYLQRLMGLLLGTGKMATKVSLKESMPIKVHIHFRTVKRGRGVVATGALAAQESLSSLAVMYTSTIANIHWSEEVVDLFVRGTQVVLTLGTVERFSRFISFFLLNSDINIVILKNCKIT